MKYIKVTITLPEDVVEKLSKVNNKSGELADALRFYSEWKDRAKAMMANSDKILRILEEQKVPDMVLDGTGNFHVKQELEQYSLAWWRREYPGSIFKEENGVVLVLHKGNGRWAEAMEVF